VSSLYEKKRLSLVAKSLVWLSTIGNCNGQLYLSHSQASIGSIYFHGATGFPIDYEKAYYWLMEAASQGNADDLLYAGMCYQDGTSVKQNYNSSMHWLLRRWKVVIKKALLNISSLYRRGLGVKKNYKTASYYLNKYLNLGR
jgi:TPR repeat protein